MLSPPARPGSPRRPPPAFVLDSKAEPHVLGSLVQSREKLGGLAHPLRKRNGSKHPSPGPWHGTRGASGELLKGFGVKGCRSREEPPMKPSAAGAGLLERSEGLGRYLGVSTLSISPISQIFCLAQWEAPGTGKMFWVRLLRGLLSGSYDPSGYG